MNERERRARADAGSNGFAEFIGWLLALAFIGMIVFGVGMAVFDAYGR